MKRPLCAACLAVVLLTAFWQWMHPPAYASYGEAAGREVCLAGRVYAKELKKGTEGPVLLIYVEPEELFCQKQCIPFQDNFLCVMKNGNQEPDIGNTVVIKGILSEYESARNPGQFHAKAYYAALGISARIRNGELLSVGGGGNRLKEALWQLKKFCAKGLEAILPDRDSAVLKAMLLGDKSALSEDLKALYKEAGILHILAISGLHISLLGMGVYGLLRRCRLPLAPAAFFGGSFMLLYGMMAGMPVSAKRAVGMFLLRLLADCVGRTFDMLTALFVMAALMLLEQPLYLGHAGFLLSFAAVLSIGLLKPALCAPDKKLPPLLDALLTSVLVIIGTLPVQLTFYYEVSLYAPLLNLVVLPLAGAVMLAGLAALILWMLFPPLAVIPAALVRLILQAYEEGCIFFTERKGSLWTPGKPQNWQIAIFFLLVFLLLFFKKLTPRHKAGLLCGAVLVFGAGRRTGLTVTFLDVGQGDCVCLELPDGPYGDLSGRGAGGLCLSGAAGRGNLAF